MRELLQSLINIIKSGDEAEELWDEVLDTFSEHEEVIFELHQNWIDDDNVEQLIVELESFLKRFDTPEVWVVRYWDGYGDLEMSIFGSKELADGKALSIAELHGYESVEALRMGEACSSKEKKIDVRRVGYGEDVLCRM